MTALSCISLYAVLGAPPLSLPRWIVPMPGLAVTAAILAAFPAFGFCVEHFRKGNRRGWVLAGLVINGLPVLGPVLFLVLMVLIAVVGAAMLLIR